jgi:flagellar FliJ protein
MFQFRLQRVLELREQREQQLATQLVRAMSVEDAARAALDELRASRTTSAPTVGAGDHRSVGELANIALLLQQLDGQIDAAADAVTAARATVSAVRGALTTAQQDRRVLDRLRERDQQTFRTSAEQSERREMDDIALTRYVQNDK